MATTAYTIGQVAERTGFSPSALRYYEDIGLVRPTSRTDAGYRLYDERAVARLAFIARAKQLGCTLDDIADLIGIWDGERCGPVQHRFHDLVTSKLADTEQRIDELTAFSGQLRDAAAQLAGPAVDGPCGPECACLHVDVDRGAGTPERTPIACTLDPDAIGDRLDEWRAVLAGATDRTRTADGAHVVFDRTIDISALARLVAAEQSCCAFFTFAIEVSADAVTLDVRAPAGAEAMVDALFGAVLPRRSWGPNH